MRIAAEKAVSMSMRCAVLGSPIEHSLSPALHRAAYGELGLDWTYDAVEMREAGLPAFLDSLDDRWRGLSLTMPLKRAVLDLLDEADATVTMTGVANTVVLRDGRRHGYNTDIPGAVAAMREQGVTSVGTAMILGGGATAASLGWALADLGCASLEIFVRNPVAVAETVEVINRHQRAPQVTVAPLEDIGRSRGSDVLASTIPAVAQDEGLLDALERSDIDAVFDVIYDPWPTPLASWAQGGGCGVVSGLDLLAHQAALQVQLMTDRTPSVAVMRNAGLAALAARTSS